MVPGRSSDRKASRFFSTDSRPTASQTGRGRSWKTAGGPGLKRSVSTPLPQIAVRRKPRSISSRRIARVGTITHDDGSWNRRNQR
ncbi:MAG: hypothetical protein ABS55_08160 [Lautropia sp. SCN 70-15]|nr:MAG: hypothetical protein ABS55_08160 [Lautropia sp. SCN 70-15]